MDYRPYRAIGEVLRAVDRYLALAAEHQARASAIADQAQALMRNLQMQRDCDRCGGFRYPGEAACTCPEPCGWPHCTPAPHPGPRSLWPPYCRGLHSVRAAQVTIAAVAALDAAAPMPLSTAAVEQATGYGIRHGQLCYRALRRLARLGEAEYMKIEDRIPVYWRRLGGLTP